MTINNPQAPLVSVIIPCYNDHKFICEAIDSINQQDYKNFEIIIIDDGSDRETKKVLKEFEQENLSIIYQKNSGPSCARNRGIFEAKGDYILTLDADDFFESTFCSKAISILIKYHEVGIVTCDAHIIKSKRKIGKIHSVGGGPADFLKRNGALASCMYRKKCWAEVGGYDEKMVNGYEDWEFNISIAKSDWKIHIIKEYLFNYRIKENSRNHTAENKHKYDLLKYIYQKHRNIIEENLEEFIDYFLDKIKNLEREKNNIKETSTYRLSNFILSPFKTVSQNYTQHRKKHI